MGDRFFNIDNMSTFNQEEPSLMIPQTSMTFSYNPYDTNSGMTIIHPAAPAVGSKTPSLPVGTLHTCLEGFVGFVPYPTERFHVQPPPVQLSEMHRIFVGQLPYEVTDMQLEWLCYTFGQGGAVYFPERITKRDQQSGGIVHTGCIHAYCDPRGLPKMIESMHKRILVDDTGVWYARNEEECAQLNHYCQQLKMDKRLRFQNRPYDTVVVQQATSAYGTRNGGFSRRHNVRF